MCNLPDWLTAAMRVALLGEIYPNIRAIAVGLGDSDDVLLRYYIDRIPTEFDTESIEVVATNLDATLEEGRLKKLDVECIHSTALLRDIEPLNGFIYARREY
ncbi:MAG: hypothetical protein OSA49_08590 [Ascidiaceihabitans sp.]|nr:hypothetical protein [Ascidiaceihabitans sp.]